MRVNPVPVSGTVLNSIFWGIIIPQVFLTALNIQSWSLIRGEANESESGYALLLLSFELIIILAAALILWLYRAGKNQISWQLALSSLIVHSGYMLFFLINIESIIPNSIQPWILNEGGVGRWNITLFMPGAFLSLYTLSKSFFSRINRGLIILFAIIGMPVAWYLLVSLMQPAWFGQVSVILGVLIGTGMVVFFLGAIIHFFDNIIHKPTAKTLVEKHYIIAILLGLAAPLGGLALNYKIPFPADFQSVGVYAFTVINGLLLVTKPKGLTFAPIRLFFRCIVFPFILYFFLVFLPFLPLSLMAIIIVGAGFLMLTPLALGLFQTKITLNEYALVKTKLGTTKAVVIGILGLSIIPSYFLLLAVADKNALETSLDYFYSHDTSGETLSRSQISRSAAALVQLRDRKADIQLPYISGIYNAVVFGDSVLSDKKISRIYQLLTGSKLPKEKNSMFGYRGDSQRNFNGRGVIAPKQEVTIKEITLSQTTSEASTVKLTLENTLDDTHALFVGNLGIPEGVFISGLSLKIENEWVTGRVFDRKTALWVFKKITEVRRDPALLYYLSPQQVELRVYPFPSEGIREVKIDFQFHPKMDSKITIADQKIDLNPTINSSCIVSQSGAILVGENSSELAFQRDPYIHFILDYSNISDIQDKEYAEKIMQVREQLSIDKFRITAANIGVSNNDTEKLFDTTDVQSVIEDIQNISFPKTGGLWVQQAIAKEILLVNEKINYESFRRTPVFVVISNQPLESNTDVAIGSWSWLIPDLQNWYSYSDKGLQSHDLQSKTLGAHDDKRDSNAVIAIQKDSKISLFPANRPSISDTSKSDKISIYNPSLDRFIAQDAFKDEPSVSSEWVASAEVWTDWRTTNLSPAKIELKRKEFLEKSRTQNVLLPLTSLIVVESPSQWEILKRKEKQSLSNHSGLDFEDEQQTSEPPWWLLLAGLLIFLSLREKNNPSPRIDT